MCNNWGNFPISVDGAIGGLVGDTVIICGGKADNGYFVNECYSLTSEKATHVTHMSVGRRSAASIVINDNTLWVTGGYKYDGEYLAFASTEYVTVMGTMSGPDLPMALDSHAMVAINSTCSMVIGGFSNNNNSALTFFYDRIEGEWVNGPSLIKARKNHAAGIITDEVTGEDFVAVTGGNHYIHQVTSDYLDSTEILQDGEWVQGKINDTLISGHFLVSKYFQNMIITLHTTQELVMLSTFQCSQAQNKSRNFDNTHNYDNLMQLIFSVCVVDF